MKKKLLKDSRRLTTTMIAVRLILILSLSLSVTSKALSQQKSSGSGSSGKIQGTTIYLNKDTTICLDGEEFRVILKMSNAEEYYHTSYDLHVNQIVSLKQQIKLLEEVLSISDLQAELIEAARVGDTARIAAAKDKYEEHKKAFDKISRKMKFWKVVAIIESGVIIGLGTVVIILAYV